MTTRLKAARLARGWSQSRLIHALRQQAEDMGLRLPASASLKTQVSRWENGHCTPDEFYRQLFQAVFGQSDVDLGLVDGAVGRLADLGLDFPRTWSEGMSVVTAMWSDELSRRSLLRNSVFAAAAYGIPALRWMVSDPTEVPTQQAGRRVGVAAVDAIRAMTGSYRRLDNAHGAGGLRDQAVRYLDREVAPILKEASYDAVIGRELLRATAELTQLVGWMAYDETLHGLAQRYFIQALRLAEAGGDRVLGAEILAAMSHQASYLHEAPTAIDLARAASRGARAGGVPALEAEAAVLEAQGHAVAGEERACAAALHRAETALDKADRSADPHWISYFDEAYLSAKFGHCFAALGQASHAERFDVRGVEARTSRRSPHVRVRAGCCGWGRVRAVAGDVRVAGVGAA